MDHKIIIIFVFLTILVSMQYSLNKILIELKEIKKILLQKKIID
ncbi:hypothetical protein [Proteiniborus sp. MB09-C3]|nr:hypothetical protein [Proteiniborus sp. MB09-C3]WIV11425.1 hypothetical protein QO263_15185 [Proteiniborus sp. MB09-C3]